MSAVTGTLDDLLELLADAIIESQPQKVTAAKSGYTEKHVSQMLRGTCTGSLKAWQRMLDAAGLTVTVAVATADASLRATRDSATTRAGEGDG